MFSASSQAWGNPKSKAQESGGESNFFTGSCPRLSPLSGEAAAGGASSNFGRSRNKCLILLHERLVAFGDSGVQVASLLPRRMVQPIV